VVCGIYGLPRPDPVFEILTYLGPVSKIRTRCWAFLFLWPLFLNAQTGASASLRVHVDILRFQGPREAYVELQLYMDGATLHAIPTPDSLWRSTVDLLLYFEQDGEIVQYDRLLLHSPATEKPGQDFVDIRRYGLPYGHYKLVLEALDMNLAIDTLRREFTIVIPDTQPVWSQSDPMLLIAARPSAEQHALVRNGYFMEPLPHRFYPRTSDLLYFYQEVYCRDSTWLGMPYQFAYYLEDVGSGQARRIQQALTKKRKARLQDPLLIQMDIRDLPSGNYRLVTEVRDSAQTLLSSTRVGFQRSNPDADRLAAPGPDKADWSADSFLVHLDAQALNYALKALAPRVWDKEVDLLNAIIRNPNPDAKRNFLLHFFSRENPSDPIGAYEIYIDVARVVDEKYRSGFGFGFESDRGFVLMKYGRPNDIIDIEDEPHAPPYQIWAYDEFPYTGQRNVKFLFYNPSLAPGNYLLLHSTARNERQNPRWEIDLYSRLGGNEIRGVNQQDATGVHDQYFRMARKYFEDN
jgi:GWxTD domain-containing protein